MIDWLRERKRKAKQRARDVAREIERRAREKKQRARDVIRDIIPIPVIRPPEPTPPPAPPVVAPPEPTPPHVEPPVEPPVAPPKDPPEKPVRWRLSLKCREYRPGSLTRLVWATETIKGAANAVLEKRGYRVDAVDIVDGNTIRLSITEVGSPGLLALVPKIIKFLQRPLVLISIFITIISFTLERIVEAVTEVKVVEDVERTEQDRIFYEVTKDLDPVVRGELVEDWLVMQEDRKVTDKDVSTWVGMQQMMEFLPILIIVIIVITLLSYLPRRG